MAVGALVAAIGWIRISQLSKLPLSRSWIKASLFLLGQHPLTRSGRIALWIHTIMFSILGFLAVLGFIGCLAKSRRMVSGFAIALAIHLGFSVASGIFSIYLFFKKPAEDAIEACTNGSTDPSVIDSCKNGTGVMKGIMIAIYVLTWLLQLCESGNPFLEPSLILFADAYFIVEWYVDQLDDEETERHAVVMRQPSINNYGPTYAFTSPGNAHGVTAGQDPSNR